MAKKMFVVPVYRTVIQSGVIKVLASNEAEALKAVKRQANVEVLVSDWGTVKKERPISFPEQSYEVGDSSWKPDIEGK